jgi:hypothetical protein
MDENIFVVYFVSNSTQFFMHSDVFGKHVLLLSSVLDVWGYFNYLVERMFL